MYTRKNKDPKIEPWGAPADISPILEHFPFCTLHCFLSYGKLSLRERSCPWIPYRLRLSTRASFHTLSKALEISRWTEQISRERLQANALKMVCVIEINWLIVEYLERMPVWFGFSSSYKTRFEYGASYISISWIFLKIGGREMGRWFPLKFFLFFVCTGTAYPHIHI